MTKDIYSRFCGKNEWYVCKMLMEAIYCKITTYNTITTSFLLFPLKVHENRHVQR